MAGARILIVDDNPDTLILVSRILKKSGYETMTAEDSPTARGLLASEVPDLIITDIMMPGESGFSLLTTVRESPAFNHIPVIVVSAMDAENEVMDQGAAAYLSKPFQAKELLEAVGKLVSKVDVPKLMKIALSLLKQQKYQEAQKRLMAVLKESDDPRYTAYAAFCMGQIHMSTGNAQGAAQFYKKAVQCDPRFWRAYTMLGKIFYMNKNVQRARMYWQQSLKLNPDQKEITKILAALNK